MVLARRVGRSVVGGLLGAGLLLAAVPAAAVASDAGAGEFSFDDSRIAESSGLVALPSGNFVTTNDSGDSGRVFVVSPTGKTVRVAQWSESAVDQEAVAPAGKADRIWVGDTGDNAAQRSSITLSLVGIGSANAGRLYRQVTATYPDGAHDAETLMRAPDGRLVIVTKGFLGGTLYALPAGQESASLSSITATATLERLSSRNALLAMATDGAFLPDGKHFLVRGYVSATLYAWPSLDRLGSMTLPAQRQGEGMAIASDGTLWLTSEGAHSTVLHRTLSEGLAEKLEEAGEAGEAQADPTAESRVSTGRIPDSGASNHAFPPWWPWAAGGAVGVGLLIYLARAWAQTRRR